MRRSWASSGSAGGGWGAGMRGARLGVASPVIEAGGGGGKEGLAAVSREATLATSSAVMRKSESVGLALRPWMAKTLGPATRKSLDKERSKSSNWLASVLGREVVAVEFQRGVAGALALATRVPL